MDTIHFPLGILLAKVTGVIDINHAARRSANMKYRLTILMLIAGIQFSFTTAFAQSKDKVYAALLMNFARNVEWPREKTAGDFIIGVVSHPSLASSLKSVAAQLKNIHDQPIVIKEFASASDAATCHILFISEGETRSSFSSLLTKLGATPTLLITEREGLAEKGSCINFLVIDEKLKFEVNMSSMEKRHLKPSADLVRFGIVIR